MIERTLQKHLQAMAKLFPVVSVLGPRQSGKTTLIRMSFPTLPYLNLEHPPSRQFALDDPVYFLSQYQHGVIIDEIQHVPELLSYIQVIVDEQQENGLFILTGSNQSELGSQFSQSLAGRNAILQLLPFSLEELSEPFAQANNFIIQGGFPRIFDQQIPPVDFLHAYVSRYLERDVRSMLNIRHLRQFERFLALCAGRSGQLLNTTNLGNELGVDHKTISQWISVLEASSLLYLLRPYHQNFNKRIIKSPKLYFTDTGLAAYLLGIYSQNHLTQHPLRGALFETIVISEILKTRIHRGLRPDLYFFRDNNGNEIDLILENDGQTLAIEVKSSMTINPSFFKQLTFWQKISGTRSESSFLVYGGETWQKRSKATIVPWKDCHKIII